MCTALPRCVTDLATISNLARGITFTPCTDRTSQPGVDVQLASVSITPESGLQQQFWDDGDTLDTYWLQQYLVPQLGCKKGFVADCWEAPEDGSCAKPKQKQKRGRRGKGGPRGGTERAILERKTVRAPTVGTRDSDLVPLTDPSLPGGV